MTPTAAYPRWKHLTMQVVLWGVLAATVVAAQRVITHKTDSLRPDMSAAPVQLGSFKVKLPEGWDSNGNQIGNGIRIDAAENAVRNETRRTLTVVWQKFPLPVPPIEVLRSAGLPPGGQVVAVDLQRYPDHRALYAEMMKVVVPAPGKRLVIKNVVGVLTLPDGQILLAQLNGQGQVDEPDRQLLIDLLNAIDIEAPKALPPQPRPTSPAPPGQNPEDWIGI